MNTYRFHLSPPIGPRVLAGSLPELAAESFVQTIVGNTVREFTTDQGGYQVDIALSRESHETALDEVAGFAERWGLNLAEAIVTEWVSSELPGAAIGGTSGLGLGVANDNPGVAFFAGIGLSLLGAALGSLHLRPVIVYHAQRLMNAPGAWRLTQLRQDAHGEWSPAPA